MKNLMDMPPRELNTFCQLYNKSIKIDRSKGKMYCILIQDEGYYVGDIYAGK